MSERVLPAHSGVEPFDVPRHVAIGLEVEQRHLDEAEEAVLVAEHELGGVLGGVVHDARVHVLGHAQRLGPSRRGLWRLTAALLAHW